MKKQQDKLEVNIITHYFKDDEEFSGDYSSIDILINNKKVISYGDAYHDSGDERVKGFLDAFEYIYGNKISVTRKNVADSEY